MARVQVKVVQQDGEVKFYEYAGLDLAIVALGKMVGASGTARGAGREKAGVTDASKAGVPATSTSTVPAPAADAPAAEPKALRKPRADKGQPRAPYAPRQPQADAAGATSGAGSAPVAVEQAASPEAKPATPAQAAPGTSTEVAPGAPVAPPAPASAATEADVQAAMERYFAVHMIEGTLALLKSFGAARARDLKPEQRAAFVAKVNELLKPAA